ncbi:MAG: hypothetical protein JSR18_00790 [Proteobacteria bacterium]|nr:hypothetical protein [Pseudomonadota bacterium]
MLHSFGRDFAPYDTITSVFRTSLASRSRDTVIFREANLDAGSRMAPAAEHAFINYLAARFEGEAPDVVVTIGPPAARFYAAHRDEMFPRTPWLMAALDQRIARAMAQRNGDRVVAGRVDFPVLVDNILRLQPETRNIAIVFGDSDSERFWQAELQRELAAYNDRINFIWLNKLSLEQMRHAVATLPPDSAIFYGLMVVDAAGIPHERQDALAALHSVANAPIYGIYDSELGSGIVGGPYTSTHVAGEDIATAALAMLDGPRLPPQMEVHDFERPLYDWRELQRWNIDEARLPPGSKIAFRQPSLWVEHRSAAIAITAIVLLQAAMIIALLWQRGHRRRAESEARALGGRLITAHEDERRRLARELHDDVTQRLASLAIAATRAQAHGVYGDGTAHAIRDGLVKLSEDVHGLSYRLHPSMIEDLGLVEALRAECERIERAENLQATLVATDIPAKLPPEIALCLFRIAQEALRNVVRHAKASRVEVSLTRAGGTLVLAVRDDGSGFATAGDAGRGSLGLASMRERVRLLNGFVDIESAPGRGTTVTASVPWGTTP